jgi:hypothetical protein
MNENWFYRVAMVVPPAEESEHVELEKGPNIQSLPPFHPFPIRWKDRFL